MRRNEEKILRVYFENPGKSFTVRELSRLTKIPRATVHRKVSELKKEGLLDKDNFSGNNLFRIKKINYYEEKLFECGLVRYLVKELNPSLIVLFGSFAKGDSVKDSDLDLFVESSVKKNLNLKRFESKIGHSVDLFVEKDIHSLQSHLFNNVVNGIKLYGSFKLK